MKFVFVIILSYCIYFFSILMLCFQTTKEDFRLSRVILQRSASYWPLHLLRSTHSTPPPPHHVSLSFSVTSLLLPRSSAAEAARVPKKFRHALLEWVILALTLILINQGHLGFPPTKSETPMMISSYRATSHPNPDVFCRDRVFFKEEKSVANSNLICTMRISWIESEKLT